MIAVLVPTINLEKANKYAKLMLQRAGIECEVYVMEDKERIGWVAMINLMVKRFPAEYYVYAADDAYPSRQWLAIAFRVMKLTGAGLVGFNEGKYQELNAGFGLVDYSWIKNIYDGDLLNKIYRSHYADPEITLIAKDQGKFAYSSRACLIEVVFDKDGKDPKRNSEEDRNVFIGRVKDGFGGLVKNKDLLTSIS